MKVKERFLRKVKKTDSCWEWTGYVGSHGYGLFSYNKEARRAHRISWMLRKGNIPKGLHVLHRCDNPPCVNPDHLFLGTHQDNMEDMVQKKRQRGGGYERCLPKSKNEALAILIKIHKRQILKNMI